MSFLKTLFGGKSEGKSNDAPKPAAEEDYKGYHIVAAPTAANGQFQIAGTITKTVNGETREHELRRADYFSDRGEAAQATLGKARLVIDQLGDGIFD